MTDADKDATAREQGEAITPLLAAMKRKMVWMAHDFLTSSGGTSLQDLEAMRKKIEAVEYALTCVPKDAARMYMKNV